VSKVPDEVITTSDPTSVKVNITLARAAETHATAIAVTEAIRYKRVVFILLFCIVLKAFHWGRPAPPAAGDPPLQGGEAEGVPESPTQMQPVGFETVMKKKKTKRACGGGVQVFL
jgi:hypothetical protein